MLNGSDEGDPLVFHSAFRIQHSAFALMRFLWRLLGRDRHGRMVRPWALLGPVVVLIIALPLLRPLRHPDPRAISDDETARLATVQAVVDHGTLAIDRTDF